MASKATYTEAAMVSEGFLRSVIGNRDGELMKRLKALQVFLRQCEQDYEKGKLRVAADLLDKRIMQSTDKSMKAYAACCIADLIRICPPEGPYKDAEASHQRVWRFLLDQFSGLDTPSGPLFTRYISILESLNKVKASVLINDLDLADELLLEFLNRFYAVAASAASDKVEREAAGFMAGALDEAENPSPALLSALLEALVPPLREERPERRRIASRVLEGAAKQLERPVNEFLTALILQADAAREEGVSPELGRHLPELVAELGAIGPNFVVYALPIVDDQLRSEEVDVRLRAMELSRRLALAPGRAAAFQSNFFQRFDDVSAKVREAMCGHARALLAALPPAEGAFGEVLGKCEARTQDSEERVRLAAAAAIWEAMRERPGARVHERESAVAAVARCLLDRKAGVRREAARQLAAAYDRVLAAEPGAWAALRALPARLFAAYSAAGNPSLAEDRAFLDAAVEDVLLPAEGGGPARARRLLALYRSCAAAAARAGPGADAGPSDPASFLAAYLREHARCMAALSSLAQLRARKAPLEGAAEKAVRALAAASGAPEEAARLLRAAYQHKDNKAFAALARASDPDTGPAEARAALADALGRLGLGAAAKGAEAEAARAALRRAAATTLSAPVALALAEIAQEAVAGRAPGKGKKRRSEAEAPVDGAEARDALALLRLVAEACPRAALAAAPTLQALAEQGALAEGALRCLAPAAPLLAAADPHAAEELRATLVRLAGTRGDGGRAAKAAVHCCAALGAEEAAAALAEPFAELAGELEGLRGVALRAALRTAAAVALRLPQLFDGEKKALTRVLVNGLIFGPAGTPPAKSPGRAGRREARPAAEPSESALVRAAAAKVLVNFVRGLGPDGAQAAAGAVAKVLQRMMEDLGPDMDEDPQGALDAEFLRGAAALGLARLSALRPFVELLGPPLFLPACWPMQDATATLRRRFALKLERQARGAAGLAPRFLAALALGAEDPVRPNAAAACAALRATMADWRRRTAASGAHVVEDLVPFLVFVLAHRPALPDDRPHYKGTVRCLQAFLGPLLEAGGGAAFPYVQQLLLSVKQTADAHEPSSTALQEVADVALHVALEAVRGRPAAAGPARLPQVALSSQFFAPLDRAAAAERLGTTYVSADALKGTVKATADGTPHKLALKGRKTPRKGAAPGTPGPSQQSASSGPKSAARRRRPSDEAAAEGSPDAKPKGKTKPKRRAKAASGGESGGEEEAGSDAGGPAPEPRPPKRAAAREAAKKGRKQAADAGSSGESGAEDGGGSEAEALAKGKGKGKAKPKARAQAASGDEGEAEAEPAAKGKGKGKRRKASEGEGGSGEDAKADGKRKPPAKPTPRGKAKAQAKAASGDESAEEATGSDAGGAGGKRKPPAKPTPRGKAKAQAKAASRDESEGEGGSGEDAKANGKRKRPAKPTPRGKAKAASENESEGGSNGKAAGSGAPRRPLHCLRRRRRRKPPAKPKPKPAAAGGDESGGEGAPSPAKPTPSPGKRPRRGAEDGSSGPTPASSARRSSRLADGSPAADPPATRPKASASKPGKGAKKAKL